MDSKIHEYINNGHKDILNKINWNVSRDSIITDIDKFICNICNKLDIPSIVSTREPIVEQHRVKLEPKKKDINLSKIIDKEALNTNTTRRCPVVILVDCSASMGRGKLYRGTVPIIEVNKGIKSLFQYIKEDYNCSKRCEVALISFNEFPTLVSDFSPITDKKDIHLKAIGPTNFGPALNMMLDKIEERKKVYDYFGRSCYRPIVILLTDGGPGDIKEFKELKQRIYNASLAKKLTFHAIKVGTEENLDNHKKHFEMLQGFDATIPASLLDVSKIGEFFNWLSRSVGQRSKSDREDDSLFLDSSSWRKDKI